MLLGFDYGAVHIGVARAEDGSVRRLTTLKNDNQLLLHIEELIAREHPAALVVGWPRGLDGQHTEQTKQSEAFAHVLEQFHLPVHLQDEAGTSDEAKSRIGASIAEQKKHIHEESAVIILEDYVQTH